MTKPVGRANDGTGRADGYWLLGSGPAEIDPVKMLRIHGYRDLGKVRPVIRKAADDIAEIAKGLMVPEAHARRVDVEHYGDQRVVLANGVEFGGIDFEHALDGARAVVVVVVTVGRALDDAVITAMDKFEPLDALFLETAGWLGVEWATKNFVRDLQKTVKPENLRVTHRRGPGYRYKIGGREMDWPLEQQRRIFDVFDEVELPISLLESCVMLPKMSRSGMYGLVSLN